MANCIRKKQYYCYDDCNPGGCPGHEAVLEFESVSNAYKFTYFNGKREYYFEQGELQALIDLLKELRKSGYDMVKI